MMHDTIEARRELLADKEALERFPLLRARADWPPEEEAALNLTSAERAEFKAFWQEVYRRQLDPDRQPDPVEAPAVAPAPEAAREDPTPQRAVLTPPRVPEPKPRYDMALTLWETTDKAAREWAALELALARAQQAQGREPINPRTRAEWHDVIRASNDFKATIAELRAQAEQNRAYSQAFRERYPPADEDPDRYPVQGPDGRAIAPSELDRAQDAMLEDVSRRDVPEPPRPAEAPAAERRTAERAVLREAQRDADRAVRKDPALAWLDDPSPYQHLEDRQAPVDPALQWLRERDTEPERDRSPERDRDR